MVILNEIVQGSSSGSHDHNNQKQYDVFLSFRGADTRNNFTAYLYDALIAAGIKTFLDNEEIETGGDLKPELEDAIRSSRASVIVLSEKYATSTWCLDELALILEQRSESDHIVIPIFYLVEPTDVRKQQESFGDAMAKHREKMEKETNVEKRVRLGQKMDRWTTALGKVAGLKGIDVKGRKDKEFIEEIVTEILQRLGVPLSDTLPLLIGRYDDIEEITSWLTDGSSSTADILTISGMGGIGKTSLAKYVFHLHSCTFHKSSFIEGINLRCPENNFIGLLDLQKQLYYDISNSNKQLVHDTLKYTSMIERALAGVKVFLVLDDISSLKQLDALLGKKGFHPGSKIIITTQYTSLTERCALFNQLEVKPKHTKLLIESLDENAALELLCLHAFKCKYPKKGYEKVVKKVMKYCQGHPMALEVLGNDVGKQDIAYWEGYIEILKNETHLDFRKVLRISFDSLPFDNHKELFKHIACFFVGMDQEISEKILEACNITTKSGIPYLMGRCLLKVNKWNNSLMMHQLLQEMGKTIVREESPNEPGERSRLWCHDESFKVLKRKTGTARVKGLVLDTRMLEKEKFCVLETDAFSNMYNLMILHLNYVQLNGSYEKFPEELRWLHMRGFPLKSIPLDLQMEKLVVLDMSYSNIESFGTCSTSCKPQPLEGGKKVIGSCSKEKRVLGSLKILDLSFCEQLHKLGGFYQLPTLERLIARCCTRLIEIDGLLEECVELVHVDLSYCMKLEKFPTTLLKLKNLKNLLADGCNFSSPVEKIPSDLNLCVIPLPSSPVRLSLENNNLSNESFPMDMRSLSSLKYLSLNKNPIVSMPNCVRSLCNLEELRMVNCETLMLVEHPPPCKLKRLKFGMSINHSILQRVSFDPDMSSIIVGPTHFSFQPWSYEIQGMVKIQPLEGVEEKVLSSLGWTNSSDFLNIREEAVTYRSKRTEEQFQIQMYYEFGIFSTFYGGQEMPDCITSISSQKTPIISFTIPSSPNKHLRGLNFCYVQRLEYFGEGSQDLIMGYYPLDQLFKLPKIEIKNKTKNRTWIYNHCMVVIDVGGDWITFISHWMFGMNEMDAGDHIIITLEEPPRQVTEKCGVGLVYEDEEEEEDALEYYKSWNHIIGGDLSSLESQTGKYVLSHCAFTRTSNHVSVMYKDKRYPFRAFFTMRSTKTLRKGKMVGISDHRHLGGVEGVPLSEDHFLRGASTSKLHIRDDDNDDRTMTEEKEKMDSAKTLHKEVVVGVSDHRLLRGVQGVSPSQAHSLLGASTSKLQICNDDDDGCMMTENEEKEKMGSARTLCKGKVVGIDDHQSPRSVQGVTPCQAHSLQEANTSKLHICNDDDDYMMTECEKKEKKECKEIKKRSYWRKKMICWCCKTVCVDGGIVRFGRKRIWRW